MPWYRRIKAARSRADRIRANRVSPRPLPLRQRKPLRVRDPDHIFYSTYSTDFWLSGYKAKVISRWGIAKFFGTSVSTIYKWANHGVLPDPFVVQERGQHIVPLYLSSQIRCLMVVIRDLVEDGYITIPWQYLPEHFDMLHAGYDESRKKFKRRLSGETHGGPGHTRGVFFEEDE